jgi:hypothetical protein
MNTNMLCLLALEFKEIEYEYKAVHLVKGGGQQVLHIIKLLATICYNHINIVSIDICCVLLFI